jgi:cytochrome c oxidase subunit II
MSFEKLRGGRAALGRISGILSLAALVALVMTSVAVAADPHVVQPQPWQLGFQEAATPVKERIAALHGTLLIIITGIVVFVLGLLGYVMLRFNARANPVPSRFSHNTLVEVIWTIVPVMILVFIAIPSFRLMYFEDKTQKADMTVKVTGHQWYWTYEYPDHGGVSFDSNMVPTESLQPGQTRLLDVDNRLIVPVGENIRVLVAGSDVMHSWFVPSFGVQMYSVPGRLNETWFNVGKEGVYYGQCNQICGINHALMPIVVEAVSKEDFDKWIAGKKSAAKSGTSSVQVAQLSSVPVTGEAAAPQR